MGNANTETVVQDWEPLTFIVVETKTLFCCHGDLSVSEGWDLEHKDVVWLRVVLRGDGGRERVI